MPSHPHNIWHLQPLKISLATNPNLPAPQPPLQQPLNQGLLPPSCHSGQIQICP
ncbi:hypothetical protein PtA15_1A1028 [Puccinia triticina]|uniref:Uncharacterized protein n=1 Tax=Puccinia triticina TaxID=208348 RepID=A0ABY7CC11_9BASI|nr:uncharacterized protein PtA15_1A1028 [Puccinia triticina]WAQ81686.1 hypothetical protein PtA15_1A1028 [Puccinia triticina]